MSYDLMVFEPSGAPRDRSVFLEWYEKQTQWSEGHSYDDPQLTSPSLQAWFQEMIQDFPPMNGPLASDDVDDPRITDYSIASEIIYAAFAWSCAEEAYAKTVDLAIKHSVGFFDVSSDEGQILFPGDAFQQKASPRRPWWRFW